MLSLRLGSVAVVACLASGCVAPKAITCSDGVICPSGTVCALVVVQGMPTDFCVDPAQLEACTAGGAPTPCDSNRGTCHDGVCLPDVCGNGLVDIGEACDDHNTIGRDGCSADCLSTEVCGNGIPDVSMGEACDVGDDHLDHDGCTSTCQVETLRWDLLGFSGRSQAAMTYDSSRHRVVLFGGSPNPFSFDPKLPSDTWEWDGRRWVDRSTFVRPTGRALHDLVYDAADAESLLFGGETADTWSLGANGWVLESPSIAPPARRAACMAYDAARHRILLVGGIDPTTLMPLTDMWSWHGHQWQLLPTPSPAQADVSVLRTMAYDPKRDAMVMFGGNADPSSMWEFDGAVWAERHPNQFPHPFGSPKMAFDPVGGHLLLVGGDLNTGMETWSWNGSIYTQLQDLPVPAYGHMATTDLARGRVVVHTQDATFTQNWVYEWDGSSWSLADHGGVPPLERVNAVAETDPTHREIVLFGGQDYTHVTIYGETWVWNGTWKLMQLSGQLPTGRIRSAMAYDPIRDELVMFGGQDSSGVFVADTWIWKNHQWTRPVTAVHPSARFGHAMAFDAASGRIILFGGMNNATSTTYFDETWSWDGSSWTLETPSVHPSARMEMAMGRHPIRDRIVLFGGRDATSLKADTWTWDGLTRTWTQSPISNPTPSQRERSRLVWDAAARRLLLVGGDENGVTPLELWAWDGSWQLVPTTVDPPFLSSLIVSAIDGAGLAVLSPSAPSTPTSTFGVWRLRWQAGSSDEICTSIDTDGDTLAGCQDPDCWSACTPGCQPGATCTGTSKCGDGVCNAALESCDLCPADCGACAARCGDFTCNGGETIATCPGDCTP